MKGIGFKQEPRKARFFVSILSKGGVAVSRVGVLFK
tara:strand:+ start:17 stop:124 length:108 start_codon:yes stop_codon:yes gene_type:complete